MKTVRLSMSSLLFFLLSGLLFLALPASAAHTLAPIVKDSFDTYTNGILVGQGGWSEYANGANFIIQSIGKNNNKKYVYNNSSSDSVITKVGTSLSDGRQGFLIKTQNRAGWGSYPNGNVQVRLLKGDWGGSEIRNFAAVSFKQDGNVAYYDPINDTYQNFAAYQDNKWIKLEIEWRSSDKTTRFRINNRKWTDWKPIAGSGLFTDFDRVGFDTILLGTGAAYYDSLR